MKLRITGRPVEFDEEAQVEALRQAAGSEAPVSARPEAYWQNLIIRTNSRIDEATSPKALTISWALRVALPGVLSITSFMIGLRYFVPTEGVNPPLQAVVLAMPDGAVDTLLSDPSRLYAGLSAADFDVDPFDVPNEDLADYLISSGTVATVTESLNDEQVTDVLTVLGTRREDRFR
jgi:hypothetical protein